MVLVLLLCVRQLSNLLMLIFRLLLSVIKQEKFILCCCVQLRMVLEMVVDCEINVSLLCLIGIGEKLVFRFCQGVSKFRLFGLSRCMLWCRVQVWRFLCCDVGVERIMQVLQFFLLSFFIRVRLWLVLVYKIVRLGVKGKLVIFGQVNIFNIVFQVGVIGSIGLLKFFVSRLCIIR